MSRTSTSSAVPCEPTKLPLCLRLFALQYLWIGGLVDAWKAFKSWRYVMSHPKEEDYESELVWFWWLLS